MADLTVEVAMVKDTRGAKAVALQIRTPDNAMLFQVIVPGESALIIARELRMKGTEAKTGIILPDSIPPVPA